MRCRNWVGMVACASALVACGEVGPGAPSPEHDQAEAAQTNGVTPQVEWTQVFGAEEGALTWAVDVLDNVYVAGTVSGTFDGQPDGFRDDGFVRKYDEDGEVVWTRQFDLGGMEDATGVAVDQSGVYVTGSADFIIPGRGILSEGYVRRYTLDGSLVWSTRLRPDGLRNTEPADLALDASGVYVAGTAGTDEAITVPGVPFDAFVIKLSEQGEQLWTERFGDPAVDDAATGVDAGAAGVYVAGWTVGSFPGEASEGGSDAFVRRLQRDGEEIWTRQFGTRQDDEAEGVAARPDSVYVAGWTEGRFFGLPGQTTRDGFVRRFRADAAELQTDRFDFGSADEAQAIDATADGVYVGGYAFSIAQQGSQALVRRYGANLEEVWTLRYTVNRDTTVEGIAAQPGAVYAAGLASPFEENTRSFLSKIVEDGVEPPPGDCEVIDEDVVIDDPKDLGRFVAIEGCFEISGGLFIQNARDVYDLQFLSGLRSVGGYVGIADNPQLESLAGLEDLASIGEGLVIEGNANLVSVTELDSLEQVDGVLHIFGNPQLPTCEAEELVEMIGRANISGQLIIAGTDDDAVCR